MVSANHWEIVSTAIAIATDYAAAVTGVGDPTFHPTMAQVLFAAKVSFGSQKTNSYLVNQQ